MKIILILTLSILSLMSYSEGELPENKYLFPFDQNAEPHIRKWVWSAVEADRVASEDPKKCFEYEFIQTLSDGGEIRPPIMKGRRIACSEKNGSGLECNIHNVVNESGSASKVALRSIASCVETIRNQRQTSGTRNPEYESIREGIKIKPNAFQR